MFTFNRILAYLCTIIALSSCASAFFLNWGSSEPTIKIQRPLQSYPVNYYHQRRYELPSHPQLAYPHNNVDHQQLPIQVPAIPIQVPLQAQLAAMPNIQNVQLVPCLCPVTPDPDFDKGQEGSNSVFVNQMNKSPQS